VALAEDLAHPLSLTETLFFAALFYLLRREGQIAQECAEAAMTLATQQGFQYFLAVGIVMRGGALIDQGHVEEGIVQIQEGLAAFQAMGAEGMRIIFLPMLAAAYAKVGQVEEGLAVLADALTFVTKTGRRVVAAGLYVLKGGLLLARSGENQTEAEACFLKAIEIAQSQQAKS
jgi:predicted ATPase